MQDGLTINLYGEVQKEVLAETLKRDFGVEAVFCGSQTRCVERPVSDGECVERLGDKGNPFQATLGIRIEPGEAGSGIVYRQALGSMPLAFYRITEETVLATLECGYSGWTVVDCVVTLVEAGFSAAASTGADYRKLAPLVVAEALRSAGTVVCEPIDRFRLELPADVVGAALSGLMHARAVTCSIEQSGDISIVTGTVPTADVQPFEQRVPALSRGEGVWVSSFDAYSPVPMPAPVRARPRPDPFNRKQYLAEVSQL
jgi:ribosomal protection tetracycline resistance protein